MENIIVLFGGKSVEHDISIITAMQVFASLPSGYNFVPIYIDRDEHWWRADNLNKPQTFLNFEKNVKNKRLCTLVAGDNRLFEVRKGKFRQSMAISCALVCCHGGDYEGGGLQGLLKLCKIPYTCPDYQASVVCMDKVLGKLVLQSQGIKTPDFFNFSYGEFSENQDIYIQKCESLGYPLIVKPARCGSSVGIVICANREELLDAISFAKEYDNKILVEKYLAECKEYCCACMQINGKSITSKAIEISKSAMYSFEDKYIKNGQNKKVEKELQEQIRALTKKVYSALNLSGLVRIDFLGKDNEFFVCEINTIPGSLAFNLFETNFADLITNLIQSAVERDAQDKLIYTFSSDAIERYISFAGSVKGSKM